MQSPSRFDLHVVVARSKHEPGTHQHPAGRTPVLCLLPRVVFEVSHTKDNNYLSFAYVFGCRMMMIFVFRNPQPVAFRFAAKSRTLGSLIDIFGGSRESAGCGIWKARRNSAWGFDNRPDFILVGGGYWKIRAQIHAAGMCVGIPIILSIWVGKFVCYANSRGMRWSWNGYWKGISKFSLGFWEKIKNILYILEADTL